MANRRMLHDSIWESRQFISLPDKAKLLYIGLISVADDDGRFKAAPQLLKSKIFPYDRIGHKGVKKLVDKIQQAELICLYESKSAILGYHPNWTRYQQIRADRRKINNLPAPLATICPPDVNQSAAQNNVIEYSLKENNGPKSIKKILEAKHPNFAKTLHA